MRGDVLAMNSNDGSKEVGTSMGNRNSSEDTFGMQTRNDSLPHEASLKKSSTYGGFLVQENAGIMLWGCKVASFRFWGWPA